MTEKEEGTIWHVRAHPKLDQIVEEAIKRDLHTTKAELIRDAVIEYLERKFPRLMEKYRR